MRRLREHASSAGVPAALIGLSWVIEYAAGGASIVPPHLVYLPVLLAGWRYGVSGAVVAGVAGGVIVGPLLPADVATGETQVTSDWVIRLGFFTGIGAFMAVVLQRWRAAAATAVHVVRREQELALRESVFLQTASHEIRTPLTVVMGVARTLEHRGMVTSEGAPLMESLVRSIDRLDRLCTITLASVGVLDEIAASREEVIDLREMMLDLAAELEDPSAQRRLRLRTPRVSRRVWTQARLLRPALSALLDNALRFSPPAKAVEIVTSLSEDSVQISILDFGTGFNPDYIGRAFDPFTQGDVTLRREHGGLGVGLFAARRLVEQLGGTISIVNREVGGAEVAVLLPPQATVREHLRREVRR